MPDLQVGRGRRVPGSGAAGLRWPWLSGKAARHSSSYSAAKVDVPSPLRSKSPGHSYLTKTEQNAQPSGRNLLAVRRSIRTDAGEKGATASMLDTARRPPEETFDD